MSHSKLPQRGGAVWKPTSISLLIEKFLLLTVMQGGRLLNSCLFYCSRDPLNTYVQPAFLAIRLYRHCARFIHDFINTADACSLVVLRWRSITAFPGYWKGNIEKARTRSDVKTYIRQVFFNGVQGTMTYDQHLDFNTQRYADFDIMKQCPNKQAKKMYSGIDRIAKRHKQEMT